MRLFIAIPFDPPVPDALAAAQATLRAGGVRGNYTNRQNLHMTLAFLGEVRDPRPVIAVLEQVPLPESSMRFEKTELFRDILVCSFRTDASLAAYVHQLRRSLEQAGIKFDRKPFRPHVTLVRRAVFSDGRAQASAADDALRALAVPVRRVCLMRTDFIDRRPKYTPVRTFSAQENAEGAD